MWFVNYFEVPIKVHCLNEHYNLIACHHSVQNLLSSGLLTRHISYAEL